VTPPYVCGTTRAYQRHNMLAEVACEACLAAHRDYIRTYRRRRQARAEWLLGRLVPHREVSRVLRAYGP
jgi:hypothetical protein